MSSSSSSSSVSINDNVDILAEILCRLDGRSVGVAACVCRLWSGVCRRDSVWEAVCSRHVSGGGPGSRGVVTALGGYRSLYRVCVGPVLDRLQERKAGWGKDSNTTATTTPGGEDPAHLSLSLSLSLSLFSIDCYERLNGGGGGGSQRSSLLFLANAVDVA